MFGFESKCLHLRPASLIVIFSIGFLLLLYGKYFRPGSLLVGLGHIIFFVEVLEARVEKLVSVDVECDKRLAR